MTLAGPHEIAEALGAGRRTVYDWFDRPGFPEPLARLKAGPVYDLDAVRNWKNTRDSIPFADRYGRGGGVPPEAHDNTEEQND